MTIPNESVALGKVVRHRNRISRRTVVVGDVYGRWTVLEPDLRMPPNAEEARRGWRGKPAALCQCSCPAGTVQLVRINELISKGGSCGCWRSEKSRELMSNFLAVQWQDPGFIARQAAITSERFKKHGFGRHPLGRKYYYVMKRCYSPSYAQHKDYGGRGIRMYGPWHDIAVFVDWVSSNLGMCPEGESLDRIDNDSHYMPGNLKWSTRLEQTRNRGHGIVIPISGPPCVVGPSCACTRLAV